MKIELKSLKINNDFSEETICFKADVFINGKKVAYASNDGRGGCTFYNAYTKEDRPIIEEAEKYCKALPKLVVKIGNSDVEFKQSLESVIDDLVAAKEKEKEDKKLQKLFQNSIVYGRENGLSYKIVSFKSKQKFTDLIKTTNGKLAVKNLFEKIKNELKDDEKIFNTNLEELLK